MTSPRELPDLIREAAEMSREYLIQETVEPAKKLGRFAGFSFAAALLFGIAALLGGIALNRWIVAALPDGRAWSGLGYVLSALALVAIIGIIFALGSRNDSTE